MSASNDAMLALAERFFGAVVAGDTALVRSIYAPDAVIWHNNDRSEQDVDANLAILGAITKLVSNFRYEEVRRSATADGFVEQHVVRGTTRFGGELDIPACIVCTVREGRITRLDEYLDAAAIEPMLRRS